MVLEMLIAWVKGSYRIFMTQCFQKKSAMLMLIDNVPGPCFFLEWCRLCLPEAENV